MKDKKIINMDEFLKGNDLTLRQQSQQEKESFITGYDDFIQQSSTENLESFIRSVAEQFYSYGYRDGQHTATGEPI